VCSVRVGVVCVLAWFNIVKKIEYFSSGQIKENRLRINFRDCFEAEFYVGEMYVP
jgi:hypothetical protein